MLIKKARPSFGVDFLVLLLRGRSRVEVGPTLEFEHHPGPGLSFFKTRNASPRALKLLENGP